MNDSRRGHVALLAIAAFFIVRFAHVVALPLLFDDYAILEKVRRHSLAGLWAPNELLYGWYRPWSREMHFALIDRAAGANPLAFHVAGLLLTLGCLAAFFTLARRLCGVRAAVIACAGLAAVDAWSGALMWAAGAQESWMLLFALLALHATLSRRDGLATLALAGALLSKETAGVLPAIMGFAMVWIQREPIAAVARRMAGHAALTFAWLALHPTLRARLLGSAGPAVVAHGSAATVALRSLGAFVNLERIPRPDVGVAAALWSGLPAVLVLAGALAWNARRASGAGDGPTATGGRQPAPARVVVWALAWAALALVPLFVPGIVWAGYYTLFAACGVWLAAGALLALRPVWAIAPVLAVASLQPLIARTPAWEWGAHAFQSRAAYFVSALERSLRATHPRLEPHARLYFADVPQSIGVGRDWFDPAFHAWYGDTTLTGAFLSEYRPRDASTPPGADLFFRFEPPIDWVEVRLGPEDLGLAEAANPRWVDDHRRVIIQLGLAGDWPRAAAELRKLAAAHPDDAEFPTSLAYALKQAGDAPGASSWQARADSLTRAAALP